MISAKIIKDSVSPTGVRLTTFEIQVHRYILAEVNTHRVLSRNSASSRARPLTKTLAEVKNNLAYPKEFGINKPGMQAEETLSGTREAAAKLIWKLSSIAARAGAYGLMKLGVHKQVANRILEPYMWHRMIITATEWDGFFALRAHPLTQPEFQEAAYKMRAELDRSIPTQLTWGEYHLPFIQEDEVSLPLIQKMRISAARCARVSYLTHDGDRNIEKDLQLFNRLNDADPAHASPFEHVATPDASSLTPGNFKGWAQMRHIMEGYTPIILGVK